jgi:hypothetical protein
MCTLSYIFEYSIVDDIVTQSLPIYEPCIVQSGPMTQLLPIILPSFICVFGFIVVSLDI